MSQILPNQDGDWYEEDCTCPRCDGEFVIGIPSAGIDLCCLTCLAAWNSYDREVHYKIDLEIFMRPTDDTD
jgi:hypothetical protein